MLSKAALEFIEQGRQQGRQEGRLEGRLEGLLKWRNMVSLLLETRFGPLSADLRTRMEQATEAELDMWADRVLDAASLEEVFGAVK